MDPHAVSTTQFAIFIGSSVAIAGCAIWFVRKHRAKTLRAQVSGVEYGHPTKHEDSRLQAKPPLGER
jgi:hypothetical protein